MPCHVISCCNFKTSWALTVKRGIELCPFSASLELLSNLLNCTSIKEDFCRSRRQQFNISRNKLRMQAKENTLAGTYSPILSFCSVAGDDMDKLQPSSVCLVPFLAGDFLEGVHFPVLPFFWFEISCDHNAQCDSNETPLPKGQNFFSITVLRAPDDTKNDSV